jgi:hypothetical protein
MSTTDELSAALSYLYEKLEKDTFEAGLLNVPKLDLSPFPLPPLTNAQFS